MQMAICCAGWVKGTQVLLEIGLVYSAGFQSKTEFGLNSKGMMARVRSQTDKIHKSSFLLSLPSNSEVNQS